MSIVKSIEIVKQLHGAAKSQIISKIHGTNLELCRMEK